MTSCQRKHPAFLSNNFLSVKTDTEKLWHKFRKYEPEIEILIEVSISQIQLKYFL